MYTSDSTTNILKALIEAAPEISSISKTKQAYGYKYATLDSLIDMLRSVLPKHGLWFIQMPTRIEDKSTLTTRVFHESGEWIEDTIEMTDTELQGKVNDTQRLGASITYFRRYALSAIFGVSADEDIDGNINNRQQSSQQNSTPQKSQPSKNQKIDPNQYISNDFKKRIDSGESKENILADYAKLLNTSDIQEIEKLSQAEAKALAIALYTRNQNSSSVSK